MQAIILAGGKGTRLKPFTSNFPKPLVPIGDKPILEIVLKQLKHFGFTDITIAVNHLAELIMAFFGDGSKLGLKIKYSIEDTPLGTAGPLSIIDDLDDNFLVMNGDLLTTLNFKELFDYHLNNNAIATITTYKKELKIDLGVLEIQNNNLVDYIEKPVYSFNVSTGIYIFNKKIIKELPFNVKYDLPDLIKKLLANKKSVNCFSKDFFWLDIGRVDDYENALEIFTQKQKDFLHEE